jgi:hypothetical protein
VVVELLVASRRIVVTWIMTLGGRIILPFRCMTCSRFLDVYGGWLDRWVGFCWNNNNSGRSFLLYDLVNGSVTVTSIRAGSMDIQTNEIRL